MDIPDFVYPFINLWTLELLPPLAITNNATMSLDVQKSSSTCSCFEFFEYVPEVGLLNLMGVLFLIF